VIGQKSHFSEAKWRITSVLAQSCALSVTLLSGGASSTLPEARLGMLRNCLILFTLYSHLRIPLLPARGVRLETLQKTDKENSELYF